MRSRNYKYVVLYLDVRNEWRILDGSYPKSLKEAKKLVKDLDIEGTKLCKLVEVKNENSCT